MTPVRLRVGATMVALFIAAVALGGAWIWRGGSGDESRPGTNTGSSDDSWRTIEFEGVRVEIPPGWAKARLDDCEFKFEHWAPEDAPACEQGGDAVYFYGSATFDPVYGPGLRAGDDGDGGGRAWAGYAYAGDYAVYVSTDDRAVTARILGSARAVTEGEADPSSDGGSDSG